jgi:hypothetical protein
MFLSFRGTEREFRSEWVSPRELESGRRNAVCRVVPRRGRAGGDDEPLD